MSVPCTDFIHPADKFALAYLQSIPGCDLVIKKIMELVGEKMFKIKNTSSFLKIGPKQLPEIYNLLVKVCKKLEIDIPEIYLCLDREPNAYTYGDTEPFIVLHSGLLEVMTHEQIETVIAHECGHIVCHHVLYTTVGKMLLASAELFVNGIVSRAVVTSLQLAFIYWMRCSEYSADRVAAYYQGAAEPVIDLFMALSGGTHNLNLKLDREEYLKQAENYKELVDNSAYNKILELAQFGLNTHPLNACRAYEIDNFYKKYKTKLLLASENYADRILAEGTCNFTLRIKYEYIKPKGILKMGGAFDGNKLEIHINDRKYFIDKNNTRDIQLKNGIQELVIKNSKEEFKHSVNLQYDMCIVISWNCNSEKFEVKEEL